MLSLRLKLPNPKQGIAFLSLPLDLVLEIMIRLDHTCFPKILHVNRHLRSWILMNWTLILKARTLKWNNHIPEDVYWGIHECCRQIPMNMYSIRCCAPLVQTLFTHGAFFQTLLLKGADIDFGGDECARERMDVIFILLEQGYFHQALLHLEQAVIRN
jgi:hypothetical protein